MDSLFESLSPGGQLCVFEHNPYNPITRRIVSSCEFDEGVTLLKKSQLTKLSRDSIHTRKIVSGYCLFFPSFLRRLSVFERMLRWIPMGGQYFVLIGRQDGKENTDLWKIHVLASVFHMSKLDCVTQVQFQQYEPFVGCNNFAKSAPVTKWRHG